jgi:8-oxo-dGTP diphosphatase
MNPFELGTQKVIPAVLVYIFRGSQILMIHKKSEIWNGLGGKCEFNESSLRTAQREVFEESGIDLSESELKPLGFLQFPNFKAQKNEDWLVFVFYAELGENDPRQPKDTSDEGDLHWIASKDVDSLNLWPGDRYFIPFVVKRKPFMGTLWYEHGQVTRHWLQQL